MAVLQTVPDSVPGPALGATPEVPPGVEAEASSGRMTETPLGAMPEPMLGGATSGTKGISSVPPSGVQDPAWKARLRGPTVGDVGHGGPGRRGGVRARGGTPTRSSQTEHARDRDWEVSPFCGLEEESMAGHATLTGGQAGVFAGTGHLRLATVALRLGGAA